MRAYLTLYRVLTGICKLTAPVTPFISEVLFKQLVGQDANAPLSVHMTSYPKSDESLIDSKLEETMGLVEKAVSLGRAARSRKNLKVRQPLSELLISLPEKVSFDTLDGFADIIRDELNVKKVGPATDLANYVTYATKLNFKTAGSRLGGDVKAVAGFLAQLDSEAVQAGEKSQQFKFALDGREIVLSSDEVLVTKQEREGFAFESDGGLSVALGTILNDDLVDEGFARELVNKIQNMRKSSGLEVIDRINIVVDATDPVRKAAEIHEQFILNETLANSIQFNVNPNDAQEWNINGEKASIAVKKA
jgi:isoleucyl-tRNA synthetase